MIQELIQLIQVILQLISFHCKAYGAITKCSFYPYVELFHYRSGVWLKLTPVVPLREVYLMKN